MSENRGEIERMCEKTFSDEPVFKWDLGGEFGSRNLQLGRFRCRGEKGAVTSECQEKGQGG